MASDVKERTVVMIARTKICKIGSVSTFVIDPFHAQNAYRMADIVKQWRQKFAESTSHYVYDEINDQNTTPATPE